MSPVLTAPPAQDVLCTSCMTRLDSGGLKCCKCQKFIHLSCSELPKYLMVRYAVSSAQYCCIRCCKTEMGEEKYEEELQSISDLMVREGLLIIPAAVDAPSLPNQDQTSTFHQIIDSIQNGDRTTAEVSTETIETSPPNDIVTRIDESKNKANCKYYLNGLCKHGKKGTNCKYTHPPLCYKFIKKGDLAGGCKNGESCKYAHPRLCCLIKRVPYATELTTDSSIRRVQKLARIKMRISTLG